MGMVGVEHEYHTHSASEAKHTGSVDTDTDKEQWTESAPRNWVISRIWTSGSSHSLGMLQRDQAVSGTWITVLCHI